MNYYDPHYIDKEAETGKMKSHSLLADPGKLTPGSPEVCYCFPAGQERVPLTHLMLWSGEFPHFSAWDPESGYKVF